MLVLTSDGGMSDFLLYTLGLRDALELDEMVRQFLNEETVETPSSIGTYSYDDILGTTFHLVNSATATNTTVSIRSGKIKATTKTI